MTPKAAMRATLGAGFSVAAALLAAWIFLLPMGVRYAVHTAFSRLGFSPSGGRVSIGIDRAEISDIHLSDRSTVGLAATYSIGGLVHGRFATLEITDADLQGRLKPDGSFDIDGMVPAENPPPQAPLTTIAIPADRVAIRHVALSLHTPLGQASLTGQGALVPVDGEFQLTGSVSAKSKDLEIHAPLKLAFGPQGLALDLEPIGSQQTTGTVSLHLKAAGPDFRARARGSIAFHDFGFTTPSATVDGVNGSITLARLAPLKTAGSQRVTVKQVVVGQPIADVSLDFALDDGRLLAVNDAHGVVMGGEIGVRNQTFDLHGAEQAATVQVKGIDAAQLLALAGFNGLAATGKLDGTLPIRHKNDTFEIDDAVMNATEPGVIRYDPADPPSFLKDAQSAEISLLREALKDFHYQKLTLAVSGRLGGDEEIKMALTGSNPTLYNGKAIELNLDFSGSLDAIARSSVQTLANPLEAVHRLSPSSGDRK